MTPATTSASWSYRNGTATYRSASTSAGYRLENNQINYIEASGGEQIQISGVKSSDGFTINGNTEPEGVRRAVLDAATEAQANFEDMMERFMHERGRLSFA